ncbi:hypothetical protein GBN26_03300 [Plesiomonas shigelloides]|uniref:DUF6988 family protein n=1 Tax=Plesiomonas shigelloides TaxID=703 RepID=UPI0012613F9F|nr:hypothetical protein [Plesiomonas shigelloides]KAB7702922.1 hypothetical protein GBN26_03300 [Plesiomonas shigelloides]
MEQAKQTLYLIEKSLDNIKFPPTDNVKTSAIFYSISMEHYRSILSLIELNLLSSASALMRPLFESYVKGLWFYYCATDNDIRKLHKDQFNRKFHVLVSDLEKIKPLGLSNAKQNLWPTLNSFTHSGAAQTSRRVSGNQIMSSFSNDFIRDAIAFASNYGLLAACELALISNDKKLQSTVLSIYKNSVIGKVSEAHE